MKSPEPTAQMQSPSRMFPAHQRSAIRQAMSRWGRVALFCWLCGAPVAPADEGAHGFKPALLRVGFSKLAYLNMNRNDVEAAFKAFVETVARKEGYAITTQTQVFEEFTNMENAIKAGALDISVIDTWNYLAMDIGAQARPLFVTAGQSGPVRRYLLLTSRASGVKTLGDLRGKSITALAMANANLGEYWLEAVLEQNHLGPAPAFFGRMEVVDKPTAAVLPVFFKRKDACVVDEPGFTVMKELNPQVGSELQILTNSEPLVNSVICLANSGWVSEEYKSAVIRGLAELHEKPAGQQIFTLFHATRLVPFQPAQLDTIKRLRKAYDQSHTNVIHENNR